MQMEKLIKKQVTLSIFSFVLIGLLIIGTSVAYLRGVTTTSSYKSKIGKLDVLFTSGNTINLSTDPLEDEVAIGNTDNIYNFQVKNNGEANKDGVPYTYKIFLSSENSNLNFDTRFIKYCLIEGEEGVDISSTAITSANCNPKSISTAATFNKLLITSKENLTTTTGKNSMYYRLKVWLSNKYGDMFIPNDVIGKNYKLNILICGQSGTSLSDLTSC